MLKKFIALTLIFAMLVPFSSVAAADESSSQPTVEEILNEYHRKSFEAQQAQENSIASAYSRSASGSETSLEEETVDQLRAAGYEAYHVTGDNFDALETEINTDFSELLMNPEGSYIVVIHGEGENDSESSSSSNSRAITDPNLHIKDDDTGSDTEFYYEYNERSFKLRYVTVSGADDTDYLKLDPHVIVDESTGVSLAETIDSLLNHAVYAILDNNPTKIPFGTIASICGLQPFHFNLNQNNPLQSMVLFTGSIWTRTFTEVYVEFYDTWEKYLYAEYVTMYTYLAGVYFDNNLNSYTAIPNTEVRNTVYSPNYRNEQFRIEKAIEKYLQGEPGSFYYDKSGNISYEYNGTIVAVHYDSCG